MSSVSSCPSHGQCSCRRRFTGTFAPWETDCSSLYNLLTEHSLQRSIVALARAMRCSQSLQHIDMRRNTVHREGACALLDALDKVVEKRDCTTLRARTAHTNSTQRSARRGEIPLSSLPKNTRHVRQNMRKTSPHMRQRRSTQVLRNKSNSTHVNTKEAREPSLLTFNTIAVTQLANRSARRDRAHMNRIWSAVGITMSAARVRIGACSKSDH